MNPLGLFLEPPGPLLTHLHTVCIAYSECLPTRWNPLAERTCFSQVTVIVDGVSSQRPTDRTVALDRLARAGAVLSTAESSLFQLLGDAKAPHFKAVSKMVQEPRALTAEGGLLGL